MTLQSCWWSASRSPAQPQTPALMEQPPELWIVSSGATHHNHHPYINTEYLHWYYWWEQLFPSLHCFVNSVSHFLTFSGHLLLRRGLFKELFFARISENKCIPSFAFIPLVFLIRNSQRTQILNLKRYGKFETVTLRWIWIPSSPQSRTKTKQINIRERCNWSANMHFTLSWEGFLTERGELLHQQRAL